MTGFWPHQPRAVGADPESTTRIDPRQERIWAEDRWKIHAARWRALALAQSVFGAGAHVEVSGGALEGRFRALLHVEVPFEDLSVHEEREARFSAAAGLDPLLTAVPFIYVFSAAPVG